MPSNLSIEKAAQIWCRPECSDKPMDVILATAFAEVLDEIWSKPWLGNATTGEMLDEIKARVNCNYRTVDGGICQPPICCINEPKEINH